MATRWHLTIFDETDKVKHEGEYCTLTEIAQVFGLKRGSDLSHYRGRDQSFDRARQLMLDRWGVFFVIEEMDLETPVELADILNGDGDESSSTSSSSDDEDGDGTRVEEDESDDDDDE